jgi:lysophospholipase L1-like esterase
MMNVRLLLPPVVYAVPDIEMNVYFDNVVCVVNPANYVFDVTCVKGIQQSERWTYIPTSSDGGEYELVLEVRDQENKVVAKSASILRVIAPDAGADRSLTQLCIGDSLTHASVYTARLLDLCRKPGNPHLKLIGTHHPDEKLPAENRHEGYGGWTAERFATHYSEIDRLKDYPNGGSPFLFMGSDGKPKLDFSRYLCEMNEGNAPDVVTIFLGVNDIFQATDDNIESTITKMLSHYDTLVEMVHAVDKNIRIGVVMVPPPAASQDAFGANYGCGQTRWQYKRNQHRLVERLLQYYGSREKENIYLVPVFVNFDSVHNYPTETVRCNSQNSQTRTRLNNGVHPAEEGYRQIGDTLYCWLKSRLTQSPDTSHTSR